MKSVLLNLVHSIQIPQSNRSLRICTETPKTLESVVQIAVISTDKLTHLDLIYGPHRRRVDCECGNPRSFDRNQLQRCNGRGTCNYAPVNQSTRCVWSEKCRESILCRRICNLAWLAEGKHQSRAGAIELIYDIMDSAVADTLITLTRE